MEYGEDSNLQPQKSKKSKKRKHDDNVEEEEQHNMYLADDNTFHEDHEAEEQGVSAPKKKKKKKKRNDEDDSETADNYVMEHPDDIPIQLQQAYSVEGRPLHVAKIHSVKMNREAGNRIAHRLEEDFVAEYKPSSKFFPNNNAITKRKKKRGGF